MRVIHCYLSFFTYEGTIGINDSDWYGCGWNVMRRVKTIDIGCLIDNGLNERGCCFEIDYTSLVPKLCSRFVGTVCHFLRYCTSSKLGLHLRYGCHPRNRPTIQNHYFVSYEELEEGRLLSNRVTASYFFTSLPTTWTTWTTWTTTGTRV